MTSTKLLRPELPFVFMLITIGLLAGCSNGYSSGTDLGVPRDENGNAILHDGSNTEKPRQ
ncbi:hypothetical protein [Govanella unica]|uniref:Lipoprotein n=1 Tax=Govanella unica TaxID=2975056 RepID=A0A9X3TXE2_9PROT|nr:hypothetical protein [Govania unica]MDA5193731.1 hypothetical protein [Govania unica]